MSETKLFKQYKYHRVSTHPHPLFLIRDFDLISYFRALIRIVLKRRERTKLYKQIALEAAEDRYDTI